MGVIVPPVLPSLERRNVSPLILSPGELKKLYPNKWSHPIFRSLFSPQTAKNKGVIGAFITTNPFRCSLTATSRRGFLPEKPNDVVCRVPLANGKARQILVAHLAKNPRTGVAWPSLSGRAQSRGQGSVDSVRSCRHPQHTFWEFGCGWGPQGAPAFKPACLRGPNLKATVPEKKPGTRQ